MCGCAWGCVYSSILGGRVTWCSEWIKRASCDAAWKEHGGRQKDRSLCSPKDKSDRDKRVKPHNHLTNYNGQAPVTSGIRRIGEGLSPLWLVQAINSTLLSTQLISLSCRSSKLHDKKRADAKTKIKRWGSEDFNKKSSEQMLIHQRTENIRGLSWKKVYCDEEESQTQSSGYRYLVNSRRGLTPDSLWHFSNLVAHAEVLVFLLLLQMYEKILGPNSGFRRY